MKFHRQAYMCLIVTLLLSGFITGCDNRSSAPRVSPPAALASPARFADGNGGTLLVSDFSTGRVCFVDMASLEPTSCITIVGQPSGVATFVGQVYIGNTSTGSVEIYNSAGNFLDYLDGQTGNFLQVNDLAIDETAGLLYVLDTKAASIKGFLLSDGEPTGFEIDATQLIAPTAMIVDQATGNIIVSDFADPGSLILPRIRIFDSAGTEIDAIVADSGGFNGKYSFSTPQGLYLNGNGHLFVAEARSGTIQVYDFATKVLVKTLGSLGTDSGELFYPLDIFVEESSQDVYVADNRNGRITVYPGGGVVP